MADLERETKETRVRASVHRTGKGEARIELKGASAGSEPGESPLKSGRVAFAEHMFATMAKWSGFDLALLAESKDHLEHHLIEDAAITLARAIRKEVDVAKIERVGHAVIPMDDALVMVALDLVERPYYEGPLPDALMDHVMRSIATEAGLTLHVQVLRGRDPHHVIEAAFKALAVALRRATEPRAERLSTKGAVHLTEKLT